MNQLYVYAKAAEMLGIKQSTMEKIIDEHKIKFKYQKGEGQRNFIRCLDDTGLAEVSTVLAAKSQEKMQVCEGLLNSRQAAMIMGIEPDTLLRSFRNGTLRQKYNLRPEKVSGTRKLCLFFTPQAVANARKKRKKERAATS